MMSQLCTGCGGPLKPNVKFCNGCGAKVELPSLIDELDAPVEAPQSAAKSSACPVCSNENNAGAKFCRHCGASMDGSAPARANTAPQSEPTFARAEDDDDWGNKPTPLWKRPWFLPALLAFVAFVGVGSWYVLKQPADAPCVGSDASSRPECAQAVEAAITGESHVMYIVADANIRDQATAVGSNIITKLLRGTTVTGVIQIGVDGKSRWLKLNDGRGYISTVNLSSIEPPKLATIFTDREWYPPSDLMLHVSPSENAAVLETLPAGVKVTLAGLTDNNFLEVKRPKGGVGYASAVGFDLSSTTSTVWQVFGIFEGGNFGWSGTASDQDITLILQSPPSVEADGTALYFNRITNNRCESRLRYEGPDGSGGFVFNQSPRANSSTGQCSAFPKITVRSGSNGIDVVWKLGLNQVMAAHLYPEPEGD